MIPAFNEELRIKRTLSSWVRFLDAHFSGKYEILVVMDGCTDNTVNIVLDLAKGNPFIIPMVYPRRLGKGGALTEAFNTAQGDLIFFIDADNSLPLHEFLKFMQVIRDRDLVIGCRYFRGSDFVNNLPFSRLVLSRGFNALIKIIFPELRSIYDTQCGAKLVRRRVIEAIKNDIILSDFAFDVNLLYSTLRRGFSVGSVCVDWRHIEEQSKVSSKIWKVSFMMFISVIRLKIYYSRFRNLLRMKPLETLHKLFARIFL